MNRSAHVARPIAIAVLLTAQLFAACVPRAQIDLPPESEGADRLIVFELAEATLVYAFRATEKTTLPLTVDREGGVLSVIVLETGGLDAQLIASGRLELIADDAAGRPLPDGMFFTATFDRDNFSGWSRLAEWSESVRAIRIPPIDVDACAFHGGCFDPEHPGACVRECAVEPWTIEDREPIEPSAPMLPMFEPCRPRWAAIPSPGEGSIGGCIPIGARNTCSSSITAAFFGEAECARIGGPCPIGEFADGLPANAIRVHPSDDLQSIIALAPSGAVIALAKGVFTQAIALERSVTLAGACTEQTILSAPDSDPMHATISEPASSGTLHLRDLTVRGGRIPLTVSTATAVLERVLLDTDAPFAIVADDATIDLEQSVTRGSSDTSISLAGGSLTLGEVAIERASGRAIVVSGADTHADLSRVAIHGTGSHAVSAGRGASMILQDVLIERGFGIALVSIAGAKVHVDGVAIIATLADPMRLLGDGTGAVAYAGAELSGLQLIVLDNSGSGISAAGHGHVALAEVIIRRPIPGVADGTHGILVASSSLVLDRALIESSGTTGIALVDDAMQGPSTATISDLTISDTADESLSGGGLRVEGASRLSLDRARIVRNGRDAIHLGGDSTAGISDLFVSGLQPPLGRSLGYGISSNDSSLTLSRARIEDVFCFGVLARVTESAECAGCLNDLSDVSIARSSACPDVDAGALLFSHDHGFTGERIVIEDAEHNGIRVETESNGVPGDPSRASTLRDVAIRRSGVAGLSLNGSRAVSIDNVLIQDSHELGLECAEDATLEGSHVRIVSADGRATDGVYVYHGGNLSLDHFSIEHAGHTGLTFVGRIDLMLPMVLPLGSICLSNGVIRQHDTGVSIEGPLPPPWTYLDHVLLLDNTDPYQIAY